MAEERDTGFLAPLSIKNKAEEFAKELRKSEDTNYDEVDNKYDAIRHIGGSLALYSQYPDLASDIILNAKEYIFGGGDERAVEMDLHNNEVGKKLYEMMDEEQRKNLTTEQALEIARSYVEEFEMADEDSDLPDDMKPVYYYKEPTKPQMNEGGSLMQNEYNRLNPIPQQFPPPEPGTQIKPQYSLDEPLTIEMRQGGGIETKAGKKMERNNPNKAVPNVADLDDDGNISEYEKTRHEAIQAATSDDTSEMACGGLMGDTMGVIVGIEADSGNNIPAGSLPEEVADDIPAMLSEGEYVVPADVVRWHGVKTLEMLRQEAKIGLGLMAQDGRIAEVDEETKKPVTSDKRSLASPMIESSNDSCPVATQDLELNTKNRNSAIQADHIQYGPLNVDEPGTFWEDIAEFWDTDVNAAQKSQCGNCTAFDISPRMLECMPGETSDDDGVLGYCWMHQFKCHSARSCRTWAKGGPIDEDKISLDWQSRSETGDETQSHTIEEPNKPKVQKAKVEVVEAAEGVLNTPATDVSTTPSAFYSYKWGLDPETNRYRMIPVDPETGTEVTPDAFDPARSTRYAPQEVIAREVYGRDLTEKEDDCPEGFYFDEDAGVCMPEEEPSAVTPTTGLGGDGGDGPSTTPARVDYASQPLTKVAELMGPLSAEDLADYEGKTLADKAVSRMTTPADPVQFSLNPLALAGSVIGNVSDNIGARRAAETRAQEFSKDPTAYGAYNFNFNPDTGSFVEATPSTRITEDEFGNLTDYNNIGRSGREYTRDELFNSDINDPNSEINDVLDGIDDDLDNITAVSGGGSRNQFGSDTGLGSTRDLGGSGGFSGSRGVDENVGPGGQRSGPVSLGITPSDAPIIGPGGDSYDIDTVTADVGVSDTGPSRDRDDDRDSGLTSTADLGGREDSFSGDRGVDKNVGPGGQRSGTDDGDSGGDSKIVCTAMNNAYGFGSFRQIIWLKHSASMSPEYEAGYHVLFQPLVNYAYKTEKFGYKTLRKTLEHIARRRTSDIWKQRHGKRDVIGAVERAVLEPLCYITGYIKMRIK